jgi:hypothetical protein
MINDLDVVAIDIKQVGGEHGGGLYALVRARRDDSAARRA